MLEKSEIDAAPFHTTRGILELVRRNPEAARRALDRALAIAPADTEALSLLTRLDLQADRRAQTLARVTAAVAQNQSSPAVLLFAARTQAATGNIKEAEVLARQAVTAQPSSLAGYQLLGQIYAQSRRLGEAQLEFEQILQRQPNSVMAHTMVGIRR